MRTMKTLLLAAAISAVGGAALAADVTVTLNGVKPQGGTMLVSLQTRDQFMKPQGANGAIAEAKDGQMVLVIKDVEPGDYAVMALHDADSDWSMDRGADGKPSEGTAISGTPAKGGPPTFDQVKFTVPAEGAKITIDMNYGY